MHVIDKANRKDYDRSSQDVRQEWFSAPENVGPKQERSGNSEPGGQEKSQTAGERHRPGMSLVFARKIQKLQPMAQLDQYRKQQQPHDKAASDGACYLDRRHPTATFSWRARVIPVQNSQPIWQVARTRKSHLDGTCGNIATRTGDGA